MNSAQLRNVQTFIDVLGDLALSTKLHLYGYAEVFIDDEHSDSLCKLSYDSEDGYSIEPA
jgi:hypothetical protein